MFYMDSKLCYTFHMQRTYWSEWADFLRKWGMEGPAAWLLEAGAPLAPVGAQLLYVGQPLFGGPSRGALGALAGMLEDDHEAEGFVAFLRGEDS
jgi:hypothetical protein